jgi:hypothetical protein
MIRKLIIIVLSALALATAVFGIGSTFCSPAWSWGGSRQGWLVVVSGWKGNLFVRSVRAFGDEPASGDLSSSGRSPTLHRWWKHKLRVEDGKLTGIDPGTEFLGFWLKATNWLSPCAIHGGTQEHRFERNTTWHEMMVPTWMPFLLFAAYPTLAFIRGPLRRHRRRRRGLCLKCGYDLTGLPEPRCPECGERI